jgi:TonB family protein
MSIFPSRRASVQRLEGPSSISVTVDQRAQQMLARALATRFSALRQVRATPQVATFWAEDVNQGHSAMLEVLTKRGAADEQQVKLFYHEAEVGAQLQHPHISRATRARRVAETHFRVVELVRGAESVRALLKRSGRLEPWRAGQIALQVSQALAYAHQRGVLHLNLQPENILLDAQGEVLVSGFGIEEAESLRWAQQLRVHQCAPAYLSPEQARGEAGSRASDLYALGMLLYEMLTDHCPFDEDDLRSLFRQRKRSALQPPHKLRAEIPVALSDLVMALLARDPAVRTACYGDATQFSALLRQVCGFRAVAGQATNPLLPGDLNQELKAKLGRSLIEQLPRWPPAWPKLAPWAALLALGLSLPMWWLGASVRRPALSQPAALPTPAETAAPAAQSEPVSTAEVEQAPATLFLTEVASALTATRPSKFAERFDKTAAVLAAAPTPDAAVNLHAPTPQVAATPPALEFKTIAAVRPVLPATALDANLVSPNLSVTGAAPEPPPTPAAKPAAPRAAPVIQYGEPVRWMKASFPFTVHDSVTGKVTVEVSVDAKGNVTSARGVSGPTPLWPAAVVTARQWKFAPSTLNGVPVPVTRQITFNIQKADSRK